MQLEPCRVTTQGMSRTVVHQGCYCKLGRPHAVVVHSLRPQQRAQCSHKHGRVRCSSSILEQPKTKQHKEEPIQLPQARLADDE